MNKPGILSIEYKYCQNPFCDNKIDKKLPAGKYKTIKQYSSQKYCCQTCRHTDPEESKRKSIYAAVSKNKDSDSTKVGYKDTSIIQVELEPIDLFNQNLLHKFKDI